MTHYSSKFQKPGGKVTDNNNRSFNSLSYAHSSELFAKLKRFWFLPVFVLLLVFSILTFKFFASQNVISKLNLENPFGKTITLQTKDSYRLAILQTEIVDNSEIIDKLAIANISQGDNSIRILNFPVSSDENQDDRISNLRDFYTQSDDVSVISDLSDKLSIPIDRIIKITEPNLQFDNFQTYLTKLVITGFSTSNEIQDLKTNLTQAQLFELQEILKNYPQVTEKTLSNYDISSQITSFMSDKEVLIEQARVEISNSSDVSGNAQKYAKLFSSVGILISKVSNFDLPVTNNIIYVKDKVKYRKTLQIIQNNLGSAELREEDPAKFSTADIFVILK